MTQAAAPGPTDLATPFVARVPYRRVDVTGEDRLRYLEDVTSQTFLDAEPGDLRGALYLDVRGGPLAMFDVAVLADRVALVAPDDEVVATLVDVLGGRTFLLDATFTPTDHEAVVLRGGEVASLARAADLAVPSPGAVHQAGEVLLVGRTGGVDLLGPGGALEDVVSRLLSAGAREGGGDALEAWRVSAGVPAWGVEVVPPHLPEEAGVLPTHVHLGKGCYPGQEAVARMWMLGRPRRRLAVVEPIGVELQPGWETGEGRRRVTVTSVAPNGDLALAFVPSQTAAGDVLGDEDTVGVRVRALGGADEAAPGHDPAVTRRRDRPRV